MTIVTRFPPAPNSKMHIGSARTALLNWLYAKHNNGKFLLRIEDTDKDKVKDEYIKSIFEGLNWLDIDFEGEPIFQSQNKKRHIEIANKLLQEDKAYYCYCTHEELEQIKEEQRRLNKPIRYDGRWRDKCKSDAPNGVNPTIRLKTPNKGETILNDLVQGEIRILNEQIDDMVLVRSDGTPTYMLSVVVDDHDMGINTVIRTSDHLTNAFRQMMIINALGWNIPTYAHIPLILSNDGEKLSKDNGLMSISEAKELGYLPEALLSYLLNLGWHHETEEITDINEAFKSFDVKDMVKSPAKFDIAKLNHINGVYIRKADNKRLVNLIKPIIINSIGIFNKEKEELLIKSMPLLKERSKNLIELAVMSEFIVEESPIILSNASKKIISQEKDILSLILKSIESIENFDYDNIKITIQNLMTENNLQIEQVAPLIRATVSGNENSPPIFSIMEIMGKKEIIQRIKDQLC